MTNEIDTSPEAVDALASIEETGGGTSDLQFTQYAPTLRALSAERDALQTQSNNPAHAAKVLCGGSDVPFIEPSSQISKELRQSGYLVPPPVILRALRAIANDTPQETDQ